MGGFGSGRPALHMTCEDSLKLDLAEPSTRRAINPYANSSGIWHWSRFGEEIAAISYVWSRCVSELTLRYRCNGAPVIQTIRLVRTQPRFGGERYWFCCPVSGMRVRVLYLPAGAQRWGSRHAYKLTYQSQRDCGLEHSIMRLLAHAGSPLAQGDMRQHGVRALREDRLWQRREERRDRRNAVRRVARSQQRAARG